MSLFYLLVKSLNVSLAGVEATLFSLPLNGDLATMFRALYVAEAFLASDLIKEVLTKRGCLNFGYYHFYCFEIEVLFYRSVRARQA